MQGAIDYYTRLAADSGDSFYQDLANQMKEQLKQKKQARKELIERSYSPAAEGLPPMTQPQVWSTGTPD